ncbi:MAG: hypothetical protein GY851_05835, partial [bacterium]|nr:hypothetical protein [bacterium]
MGRVSPFRTIVCVACLAISTAACAAPSDLPDPAKPGALPVGVTTMLLVDHSRTDATLEGPRALMTEIWYPAVDDAKTLPKNKFSDFFLSGRSPELIAALGLGFQVDLSKIDTTFKNFAVRDARVRDGLYPLIVFSHGNGGMRCQNAFWCEHMA